MDVGKLKPAEGLATIAILGGDPVIGKALEALLASRTTRHDSFPSTPRDALSLSERRGSRSSCRARVASVKKPSKP